MVKGWPYHAYYSCYLRHLGADKMQFHFTCAMYIHIYIYSCEKILGSRTL